MTRGRKELTAEQREKKRARDRRYNERHPERRAESKRAYRARNLEKIRARDREYKRRKKEAAKETTTDNAAKAATFAAMSFADRFAAITGTELSKKNVQKC